MMRKLLNQFKTNPQWREGFLFLIIFVISFLVRFIAVDYGFPLLTHPDEVFSIEPVFEMTKNRTLNPGTFNRPGQVMFMVDLIYLNLTSYLRFGKNFAQTFTDHTLTFYQDARVLIAFLGSLIPLIAYKIGKQVKPQLALPAMFVFAFFPSYIQHSVYLTPDIPITLFTLLVILFSLQYINRENDKFFYLAILFSAINTAEKYPGLISLAIVFLAILIKFINNPSYHWKSHWKILIKDLALASIFFILALFIVAPFLFIEIENAITSLIFESRSIHLGADNLGWVGNLIFYIKSFASWTNIISIFFISLGIYALFSQENNKSLLLLYGALYWVVLSVLPLHWERWALPMYITPLFLIAFGIAYVTNFIRAKPKAKYFVILIVLFFAQQFIVALHTPIRMDFTDTRLLAIDYLDQLDITPENSAYEGYTPFLPSGPKNIEPDELNEEGIDYVILSSYMYDRYFREPDRYHNRIALYENIRDNQRLLKIIKATPIAKNIFEKITDISKYIRNSLILLTDYQSTGPTIEIYQIVN